MADSVPLAPGQQITVYVCLSPNLPHDSLGTGECRELIGGVRVSVFKSPLSRGMFIYPVNYMSPLREVCLFTVYPVHPRA